MKNFTFFTLHPGNILTFDITISLYQFTLSTYHFCITPQCPTG